MSRIRESTSCAFCLRFGSERARHRRLVAKSKRMLIKELDLANLIQRWRISTFTSLSTLKRHQVELAGQMANMIVDDDSNQHSSDNGKYEYDGGPRNFQFNTDKIEKRLSQSKSALDKKLLNLFRLQHGTYLEDLDEESLL